MAEFNPNKQRLSPSAINTLFQCARKYHYNYIERLPTKPNIHLLKGTAVHSVLEDIFNYRMSEKNWNKLSEHVTNLLDSRWSSVSKLKLEKDEEKMHYDDAHDIVMGFTERLSKQIEALVNIKKANGFSHAFNLLKPKFREKRLFDKNLNIAGFVDTIQEDYDGNVVIVDYKTSHKYKNTLSEDYKRQLAIYGLLYYLETGHIASYLCINYLRFGESFYIVNSPSLMEYARQEILRARSKIINAGTARLMYPKCESALCNWCDFKEKCGKDD